MNNFLNSLSAGANSIASSFSNFGSKYKTPTYTSLQPVKPVATAAPVSNVSANPSATSPAPSPIATPSKPSSVSTPAAQSYISNIATSKTPSVATPAQISTPPVPTGSPTTSSDPKNAYIQYITGTGYFDPKKADDYRQQAEDSAKRLADIQNQEDALSTSSRHEAEDTLDTPGMLKGGAQSASALITKLSNRQLADLATREGAAARTASVYSTTYQNYISAGKTGYEAETAAAKAVQDQKNKEKDQDIEQQKADSYTLSPGETRFENGKEIASGGPKPLTAAQEAKQIADKDKEQQAQQTASQALGIINGLINGNRYKAISGAVQTGSIPFIGDRAAVGEYDQLQGLLKLGVRSLIKGQGSVSDYEGKILGQAASSLSRLTDEGQFKQALQKVRGVLKTNNGQTTTVSVTNPETGETITADLSGSEIYHLVSDGNTVEYQ